MLALRAVPGYLCQMTKGEGMKTHVGQHVEATDSTGEVLRGVVAGEHEGLNVRAVSHYGMVSISDTQETGISRVYAKPGVILNDNMRGFLKELSSRLWQDVVVTSGVRTPSEQAYEMMRTPGGAAGIRGLYRGSAGAEAADAYPRGESAVLAVINAQMARGVYVSRHLKGDALDFRVTGLTTGERTLLKSTLLSMGVQVLDEGDHVHVEELGSEWGKALRFVQQTVPIIVLSSLALGVMSLGAYLFLTRK